MHSSVTHVDALERLLAVVVELVQLVAGGQHLRARVDHLQQVGPDLVDVILPLGDDRSLRVTGGNVRVADLVDGGDALLTDRLRVAAELLETLAQQLSTQIQT